MPRRNIVIDIETDSLKPTRLWCISTLEVDTDVVRTWDIREGFGGFLEFTKDPDIYWVGHNIIDFDFPVLKKFVKGFTYDLAKTRDTLVMSRLANQERDGGHSLENWGNILGFHKSEFSDFSQFSMQMLDYCIQDTRVTARVFKQVLRELADFDMRSLRIEQETVQVLQRMEERGYTLDYEFTTELLTTVTTLRDRLAISLSESAPKLPKFKRLIEPKITKKGDFYHHNVNALGDQVRYLEGQASLIDWITFNPGSHSQVAWQLMLRGWVPTVFTEAGAPSTSEEVLEELYETMPEARDITQYFMLVKRQGQIKSWVELYNHETGRVHGHINHIGARTHRASHSNPNMAQIPAVKRDTKGNILLGLDGTFNAECRKCWKAAPGFKQVGVDAAAIQLVILAHAMGDKDYADAVAFGDKKLGTDVHTRNRNVLRDTVTKLTRRNDVEYLDRDTAKTYIYAFLLGAGAAKVDTILSTTSIGASIKKEFLERIPALKALLDKLRRGVRETGRIAGLDGRFFPCDDPHFALAYILQGFETAIMKLALIYTQRWFDKHFGDDLVGILTWVHDEFQMEARDCTVAYRGCSDFPAGEYYLPELVRDKTVKIIEQVGKEFNLKCFLTGEGRVGNDWLECH